jgi:hypothetical protein
VSRNHGVTIIEFTVAPQVNPSNDELPYHEWFVEFGVPPSDLITFSMDLDKAMIGQNIYYKDLIDGKILQPLRLRTMHTDAFRNYMAKLGKLGGQNKVPRLSNDRNVVDKLAEFVSS